MSKGNEEGRAIPPEGQDGEPAEENRLSRGKFIAAAGAAGAGFMVAGAPAAMAKGWSRSSRNKALTAGQHAPGMIGGPTGFPGAARYQYPANSEEGRAVLAARALRKAGKAPDTLVVQALNFARPQFENKFPKGADASIARSLGAGDRDQAQVRGDEPRLRVRDEHPQRLDQERQLRPRHRRDRRHGRLRRGGPAAPARRLRPQVPAELERPEVRLRRRPADGSSCSRSTTAARTGSRSTTTRSRTCTAAICSTTPGRRRLRRQVRRAAHRAEDVGDQAKIAEFFNRPKASTPLYGSVERKCPFWGIVNWEHRFLCSADPNMFYFKPDGSANVNNTAGDPRGNRAPALAPVGRSRARSRRTGSRSTSSSGRATASRAARSRT